MLLTRREADRRTWRRARFAEGGPAPAQAAYPNRIIKMIVPYPAGGTTDFLGRLVADQLQTGLGATVVVENKPGAATSTGAELVARAEPDGYTLLMATSTTLAINKTLYKKLPYDPVKDFTPIALVAAVPFALIINPSIPGEDAGRVHRLRQIDAGAGLWFGRQWQSAASRRRNAEVRGGHRYPPCAVSRQRAGDARRDRGPHPLHGGGSAAGLAADPRRARSGCSASPRRKRVAAAPDIPTLAEGGLAGFELVAWQGVVAPAGTAAADRRPAGGADRKAALPIRRRATG